MFILKELLDIKQKIKKMFWFELIYLPSAALICGLSFCFLQVYFGSRIGADRCVHTFLIKSLKENRHKLFVKIPKLLNSNSIGALPLYLHWILSWLSRHQLKIAERLINPLVFILYFFLVCLILYKSRLDSASVLVNYGYIICACVLTPQNFHALNAKNFGFSARGLGALFLTLFLSSNVLFPKNDLMAIVCASFSSWLIWGFSTFAAQAMIIFCILIWILTGSCTLFLGAAFGLLIFFIINFKYASGYIGKTFAYMYNYSKFVAPVYILKYRFSIWRDLVYDLWKILKVNPKQGIRYAYENSILIIIFLNPLVLICCYRFFFDQNPRTSLENYANSVAIAGLISAIITSFRKTRFLGEPERYAEAVIPWAAISGISFLQDKIGLPVVYFILVYFVIIDLLQIKISKDLFKNNLSLQKSLGKAVKIVNAATNKIKCVCNNEQITKSLLDQNWRFSCLISPCEKYCGYTFNKAFTKYPFLSQRLINKIIKKYKINLFVKFKKIEDLKLVNKVWLTNSKILFDDKNIQVIYLQWKN